MVIKDSGSFRDHLRASRNSIQYTGVCVCVFSLFKLAILWCQLNHSSFHIMPEASKMFHELLETSISGCKIQWIRWHSMTGLKFTGVICAVLFCSDLDLLLRIWIISHKLKIRKIYFEHISINQFCFKVSIKLPYHRNCCYVSSILVVQTAQLSKPEA